MERPVSRRAEAFMHKGWIGVLAIGIAASAVQPDAQSGLASTEWGYGGGIRQIRYSPLTQINRSNVTTLTAAWTFDTGEAGALQTQPTVVDGILFGYTTSHKLFALNAATGARLWL